MPLTFVVYPNIPLVCIYGVGALTLGDMRGMLNDLTEAEVETLPRLVDLREARIHIPTAHMRQYVSYKVAYLKERSAVRVAAIASDLVTYGMLRMYQILISEQEPEYGVFRTLHEAIDWLSVAPEQSRELGA
jgi:hypothetical protein